MSDFLYSHISSLPYFQKNKDHLIKQETLFDSLERYNVVAFVKGKKNHCDHKQTVILLGHMDTVGIEDFHHLKDVATNPSELIRELEQDSPPKDVKIDLESGEFMFGRGALDMKSGLASNLFLLKYYSDNPEELAGNLVVVFECDEEDGSHGILSAIKLLNELKDEQKFDYVGAINSDFVTQNYEGDKNRYIYKGSVGKLLPAFFIAGAESHAGVPFEGLDPNFLVAELTKQISYNPELCDTAYGETTLPPVTLKQTDMKDTYDVQTAMSAYVYYNFFTHSWSPHDVLTLLKRQAQVAFENVLQSYEERYKHYCKLYNKPFKKLPWTPKVFTYEEVNDILENEYGFRYIKHMTQFKQELLDDPTIDLRMFTVRVVEEAWKWMKDQSPAMILFYASTYYPKVEVTGRNGKESILLDALEKSIREIRPHYSKPIVTKNFFPLISDMSFLSVHDSEEEIEAFMQNNPGWGSKHYVNYEDVRLLNVPVINIGPYGFDGHRKYERVEKEYSHYIVPNLTKRVIENVLN